MAKEHGEDTSAAVVYRVIAQQFINGSVVMQIETKDLKTAMQQIKDDQSNDHKSVNVTQLTSPEGTEPNEYFVEVI